MLTTTLNLGWALVFEEPITRGLWLGKATPRAWWAPGETIALHGASTRYGRLSYKAITSADKVSLNVTMPASWAASASSMSCSVSSADVAWCAAPRGGLMLRVRLPGVSPPVRTLPLSRRPRWAACRGQNRAGQTPRRCGSLWWSWSRPRWSRRYSLLR